MGIEFKDNSKVVLDELSKKTDKILNAIGEKAKGYAQEIAPYDTGRLQESIDYVVRDDVLSVGAGVQWAPYVELGTGPYFEPPPEWEQFESEKGQGIRRAYVHPRPYIRPAIEDHADEYERIAENELRS